MTPEDRLERAAAPDEGGAQDRARRVVLAGALAPVRRSRAAARATRRSRRPLAIALTAALLAGLALTPPGDALARWVRSVVGGTSPRHLVTTRLGHLPAGGQVLAIGPRGAYVLGHRRVLLGAYDSATWSPFGRFVAVTRGPLLRAVTPQGEVRWSLTAAGTVADPRWSETGFRIAYRRDDDLRVVDGDGSGDHPLVDGVAAVPVAWRQGPANQVAVARASGRVELWAADTGVRRWERRVGRVLALAWNPEGRLVVVTRRRLLVLGGDTGAVRSTHPLPLLADRAAVQPDGTRVAIAAGRRVRLVTTGRRVRTETRLVGATPAGALVFAPDAPVVLVTTARGWYALGDGWVRAVPVHGLDRATGWCCAEGSVVLAPSFRPAGDLYLRVSGPDRSGCALTRVSWASTVPFRDGSRSLPAAATARSLGRGGALVAIVSHREPCRTQPSPHRLVRQDWPGRRAGDPSLLRAIRISPTGTYSADVWLFARDAAGRARGRALLRGVRWPGDLR